jgi:hypothetical protein
VAYRVEWLIGLSGFRAEWFRDRVAYRVEWLIGLSGFRAEWLIGQSGL